MTPERYRALRAALDAHPAAKHTVIALNRWLPVVPFVCYPVLIVLLNVQWFALLGGSDQAATLAQAQEIGKAILVPAITFAIGTAMRAKLDRPRPYEQPGFEPLVEKKTKGKAFPSRHALSAAVLGAVWLYFYPAVGVAMTVVAAAICVLRVLAGVHAIRDVVFGAVLGFALGAAGMCFL